MPQRPRRMVFKIKKPASTSLALVLDEQCRVVSIAPGTQLITGDMVKSINGLPINTVEDAYGLTNTSSNTEAIVLTLQVTRVPRVQWITQFQTDYVLITSGAKDIGDKAMAALCSRERGIAGISKHGDEYRVFFRNATCMAHFRGSYRVIDSCEVHFVNLDPVPAIVFKLPFTIPQGYVIDTLEAMGKCSYRVSLKDIVEKFYRVEVQFADKKTYELAMKHGMNVDGVTYLPRHFRNSETAGDSSSTSSLLEEDFFYDPDGLLPE